MIKLFGVQLCPLDLITDSKTKQLSSAKIWQNIGFAAMTYMVLKHPPTADTMLVYGAVVAGNNVAIAWIKRKYGAGAEPSESDKG